MSAGSTKTQIREKLEERRVAEQIFDQLSQNCVT